MATFETLPAELRVEIYWHLFTNRRFYYVSYAPQHLKKKLELRKDSQHDLGTSILFVSRKCLAEARVVLVDSARINGGLAFSCGLCRNPLNTNFKIGSLLRHIEISFLEWEKRHYKRKFVMELSRCLRKLPDLRSLTLDMSSGGWDEYPIDVQNPRCNDEIQQALEDAADGGLGEMIIGYDRPRQILSPAVQARSQQGCRFALKIRSKLLITRPHVCEEPIYFMVCEADLTARRAIVRGDCEDSRHSEHSFDLPKLEQLKSYLQEQKR